VESRAPTAASYEGRKGSSGTSMSVAAMLEFACGSEDCMEEIER
jgi:hypothetical protein